MKIVGIFGVVSHSLLSVQFESEESDEFDRVFTKWNDVVFLEQFFEDNINDLQSGFFGGISVEEAISHTIDEASKLDAHIKRIAERGLYDSDLALQDLVFTSLHKNDFTIKHLQSKAYGQTYHSWLRLYAIRISKNLYVVSGGAIKLTKTMNGIPHLEDELKKLIATQEYLKEIGLFDEDDYEFIEIKSHDKR
jgi:hypothetical protein